MTVNLEIPHDYFTVASKYNQKELGRTFRLGGEKKGAYPAELRWRWCDPVHLTGCSNHSFLMFALIQQSSSRFLGSWDAHLPPPSLHPQTWLPVTIPSFLPLTTAEWAISSFGLSEAFPLPYLNFLHKENTNTCSDSCLETPTSIHMR